MEAIVRRLEPADVTAYRTVRLAGLADSPFAFGSSWDEESVQPDAFFLARIEEPVPAAVFGAFVGGTMAGTARFTVESGIRRRHVGWMTGVAVLPAYRRQGLASALVSHVVRHARPHCKVLRAAVAVANPGAHAIYVRAGFVPYGMEPRALFSDGTYYDEVLLTRDMDLPPDGAG
ncbi:GNAT family N-acetyltransferase [uncultured Alsobacter sp.]|uniref:GNAT family N-acetyltransferase n=1 Tax=uncultured Alsobacter sp. TaxID=1748258 RepID=UPI0025D6CFDC|nr:GNAT family N-acetyltransferase [uncultured Alsobacter sp.]